MAKKRKGKRTNKKKVCKKGFQCGRTCINRDRTCFSNLGKNGKKITENYAQFVKRIAQDKAKASGGGGGSQQPAALPPVVKPPQVQPKVTPPVQAPQAMTNTNFNVREKSDLPLTSYVKSPLKAEDIPAGELRPALTRTSPPSAETVEKANQARARLANRPEGSARLVLDTGEIDNQGNVIFASLTNQPADPNGSNRMFVLNRTLNGNTNSEIVDNENIRPATEEELANAPLDRIPPIVRRTGEISKVNASDMYETVQAGKGPVEGSGLLKVEILKKPEERFVPSLLIDYEDNLKDIDKAIGSQAPAVQPVTPTPAPAPAPLAGAPSIVARPNPNSDEAVWNNIDLPVTAPVEERLRNRQSAKFSFEETGVPKKIGRIVGPAANNIKFRQQPTEDQIQKAKEIAQIMNESDEFWVFPSVIQKNARDYEIPGDPTLALAAQMSNKNLIRAVSVPDIPEVDRSIRASQNAATGPVDTIVGKVRTRTRPKLDSDLELVDGARVDGIGFSVDRIDFPNGISPEQERKAQQIAEDIRQSGSNWQYTPFVKAKSGVLTAVGDPTTARASKLAGEDITHGYAVPNYPDVIQQIERVQAILARPASTTPVAQPPASAPSTVSELAPRDPGLKKNWDRASQIASFNRREVTPLNREGDLEGNIDKLNSRPAGSLPVFVNTGTDRNGEAIYAALSPVIDDGNSFVRAVVANEFNGGSPSTLQIDRDRIVRADIEELARAPLDNLTDVSPTTAPASAPRANFAPSMRSEGDSKTSMKTKALAQDIVSSFGEIDEDEVASVIKSMTEDSGSNTIPVSRLKEVLSQVSDADVSIIAGRLSQQGRLTGTESVAGEDSVALGNKIVSKLSLTNPDNETSDISPERMQRAQQMESAIANRVSELRNNSSPEINELADDVMGSMDTEDMTDLVNALIDQSPTGEIGMADLRYRLPDIPRRDFDQMMYQLEADEQINLNALSEMLSVSEVDRRAGIPKAVGGIHYFITKFDEIL